MITYIQKWGNSQGIRLPKNFLEELGMQEKEQIEIILSPEDKSLIIRKPKKCQSLRELFENYDGDYKCEEIEIGEPVGREIW
jgi:antitoxin MazE